MKNVAKLNKTLDKYNESQAQKAIKLINELYKKNPAAVIKQIENNDKLFGYIIWGIDRCPDGLQKVVLGLFTARENWDLLPKKYVTKLVNNPKFAYYVGKLTINAQIKIYGTLGTLADKGWDVLAPIGYVTNVLSKSGKGAKILAGSKSGLKLFKKLNSVKSFLKKHKLLKEGFSYAGDALTVAANAYSEYTNPDSPAYGDASKATYGGLNLFLIEGGPFEGASYGGPVGAVAGTVNTAWYYGKDILNSIPKSWGHKDSFGWSSSEADKRKWLDEQYKQYGKHDSVSTDKNYRPGVQPESGSSNFNPGTEYRPSTNNGSVNPNKSPYANWRTK